MSEAAAQHEAVVAGRQPPSDIKAEAALLSGVLLRGGEVIEAVEPYVDGRDFYSESHKWIFDAGVDLHAKGQPVDMVTVLAWLTDKQRIHQVGGPGYITEVADAAPVVHMPHLVAHAQRVRYRARLRRLVWKLEKARAEIYVGVPDDEVETFLVRVERDILAAAASTARKRSALEHIGPGLRRVVKGIDEHAERGGGPLGIPTGFTRWDEKTGGMHDGDLTIIGARPGMGKSALVGNVAENISDARDFKARECAVAIFSLEMPRDQFIARMLCSRGRANLSAMRMGKFSVDERRRIEHAASELHARGIYIDDTSALRVGEMRSKLQKLKASLERDGKRIGLVVVDYLQLMNAEPQKGESRSSAIGRLTRELKTLAKELEVPVVALAQLNRENESRDDKRPRITDLRDSGEIEQDADNILFLYRDDYYDAESAEPNICEIIIAKQRNGPLGVVKVRFDKQWTRFDNLRPSDEFDEDDRPSPRNPSAGPTPPAGFFEQFTREAEA